MGIGRQERKLISIVFLVDIFDGHWLAKREVKCHESENSACMVI